MITFCFKKYNLGFSLASQFIMTEPTSTPSNKPDMKDEPIKKVEVKEEEKKEEMNALKDVKQGKEITESEFEIISKETTTEVQKKVEKVVETKEDVKEQKEVGQKTEVSKADRKKSIDVSIIKEKEEEKKEENLEETLKSMPGMTKSVSKEILKATDEKELKELAHGLNEQDEDVDDDGSVIDISVVDDSDMDKDENIPNTSANFQAEIIGDDEEVNITPAENEQVVEFTLEMKHAIPIISAMVGFVAAIYGLIFYSRNM